MKAIEMQQQTETLDLEQRGWTGITKEEAKEKIQSIKTLNLMYSIMQSSPKPVTLKAEICKAFGIEEESIFIRSRKREIVNARQTYIFLMMTTNVKDKVVRNVEFGDSHCFRKPDPDMANRDRPAFVARHVKMDHSSMYNSCRVTQNYYETEPFYRDLIDRLRNDLFTGVIAMPNVNIPAA